MDEKKEVNPLLLEKARGKSRLALKKLLTPVAYRSMTPLMKTVLCSRYSDKFAGIVFPWFDYTVEQLEKYLNPEVVIKDGVINPEAMRRLKDEGFNIITDTKTSDEDTKVVSINTTEEK